jgi:ribosomal protein S27AE
MMDAYAMWLDSQIVYWQQRVDEAEAKRDVVAECLCDARVDALRDALEGYYVNNGTRTCASPRCGKAFIPKHGNQKFCPECQLSERKRIQMARYRERKRAKE